jgi:hypothetical protein
MLKERLFNIVMVNKNHGTGLEICPKTDRVIKYNGTRVDINF